MEQLRDYSSDSAEVPRPRQPVEPVPDACDFDEGAGCAGGIYLFHGWGEEKIDTLILKQSTILRKGSRVACEVLAGPKLSWIDKDRRDDDIALFFGRANERQMTFMQSAHGGYEPKRAGAPCSCACLDACFGACLPCFLDRFECLHLGLDRLRFRCLSGLEAGEHVGRQMVALGVVGE